VSTWRISETEGYRLQTGIKGKSMATGTQPQCIYELADGTHSGSQCCWEFGNVPTDPTKYAFWDSLFFGVSPWGTGAGAGPWFAADFEAGIWAGGTRSGDPGTPPSLSSPSEPNPRNPTLKVPFALGFLGVNQTTYNIRVADLSTATDLVTAYEGGVPLTVNHQGGIALGVTGDNSNNSVGTLYEGAIVAGYPTKETDLAVMKNVVAVGYAR
jgi:hypothetical protein